MARRVAFVLKGWPRLSETFIAQEIRALERRGLPIDIWSLRHPTDRATHPVHAEVVAPVRYLPEYLRDEPERVRDAFRLCRNLPAFDDLMALWTRDFARDRTANRLRRLGQACVLAAELPAGTEHLHAHFLHTPASVTRYAALLRGLPWSVSAHAKDIWTTPEQELSEKLADCRWAVTCTATNAAFLGQLAPPGRVELVYHGLDLSRFPPPPPRVRNRVPVILSVGRAVEKKGYPVLLEALARLPGDWRFVHVGGGPLLADLKAQAETLGIGDRIDWRGALPQTDVLAALRSADIFVLSSRIADDGDRDGLPNVLVEAQSQRVAVVASAVSAIPELVIDGETGLLVPPDDPDALAAGLGRLIADPALAEELAVAGERRVRTDFDLETCIDRLAARFGLPAHTLTAKAAS
ncbi:MAG: glycosyltransferase [Pseudomonadota bacterium]|nr:glycosyltransferase [Pseudomonadota bacterium]